MMAPNCSVSIEETSNGYVVRPLAEATAPALSRNAAIAGTLAELQAWLDRHFRRGICPKCGRMADRSEMYLPMTNQSVFACRKCWMWTVEDTGEWFEFHPTSDGRADQRGLDRRLAALGEKVGLVQ